MSPGLAPKSQSVRYQRPRGGPFVATARGFYGGLADAGELLGGKEVCIAWIGQWVDSRRAVGASGYRGLNPPRAGLVCAQTPAAAVKVGSALLSVVTRQYVCRAHIVTGRACRYSSKAHQNIAGRAAPTILGTIRVDCDAGIDDILGNQVAAANSVEGEDLAPEQAGVRGKINFPPL